MQQSRADSKHADLDIVAATAGAFVEAVGEGAVGPCSRGMGPECEFTSESVGEPPARLPHKKTGKLTYDRSFLLQFSNIVACPESLRGRWNVRDMELVAVRSDAQGSQNPQWRGPSRPAPCTVLAAEPSGTCVQSGSITAGDGDAANGCVGGDTFTKDSAIPVLTSRERSKCGRQGGHHPRRPCERPECRGTGVN